MVTGRVDMRLVKVKRIARRIPRIAAARFVEPIFNSGQILTFIAAVIALALYLQLGASAEQRDMLASEWAVAIQAFSLALLGWAVLSLVVAPFLAVREDRKLGRWHGSVFVFHEPHLLGTFRAKGDGANEEFTLNLSAVEPDSFIYYSIDFREHLRDRVAAFVAGFAILGSEAVPGSLFANSSVVNGTRIEEKKAKLKVRSIKGTVAFTIRVYCHNFMVGKGSARESA